MSLTRPMFSPAGFCTSEPAEMPPSRASRPTLGRRSAAVDMSLSWLCLELSWEMAELGAGLTVDGVAVLGSLRSGFDCPGVAAAPGSGGAAVCASALVEISNAAAAPVKRRKFGFIVSVLQMDRGSRRWSSDANTVPARDANAVPALLPFRCCAPLFRPTGRMGTHYEFEPAPGLYLAEGEHGLLQQPAVESRG